MNLSSVLPHAQFKIMQTKPAPEITQFAADVLEGLSARPKHLSSKYFYDDEGSRLFQQIMKLPEYYLTRCELEIFERQAGEIFNAFANGGGAFDLIELGAGDGSKTAILVSQFLKRKADIRYTPIDISREALDALTAKFHFEFPSLPVDAKQGDYFKILRTLKTGNARRKILLFLGSNIGNFTREQSVTFFRDLRAVMNANDLLFIGFDLQKDPHVIVRAYDDASGVTAKFNLNLLRRINRELDADFDLDKWLHYAVYRPVECAARSFLISREKQSVRIGAVNRSFEFDSWEAVFMEISQKYNLPMIEMLAADSGFRIRKNFFDTRNFYCDSLWHV
jgi:dimethylhistidine N-methyltransferase